MKYFLSLILILSALMVNAQEAKIPEINSKIVHTFLIGTNREQLGVGGEGHLGSSIPSAIGVSNYGQMCIFDQYNYRINFFSNGKLEKIISLSNFYGPIIDPAPFTIRFSPTGDQLCLFGSAYGNLFIEKNQNLNFIELFSTNNWHITANSLVVSKQVSGSNEINFYVYPFAAMADGIKPQSFKLKDLTEAVQAKFLGPDWKYNKVGNYLTYKGRYMPDDGDSFISYFKKKNGGSIPVPEGKEWTDVSADTFNNWGNIGLSFLGSDAKGNYYWGQSNGYINIFSSTGEALGYYKVIPDPLMMKKDTQFIMTNPTVSPEGDIYYLAGYKTGRDYSADNFGNKLYLYKVDRKW